jgi:hypothetical protein
MLRAVGVLEHRRRTPVEPSSLDAAPELADQDREVVQR